MTRHCRDYDQPSDVHITLCAKSINEVLRNPRHEDLAFWWGPIERITCIPCKSRRVQLEGDGEWPTDETWPNN